MKIKRIGNPIILEKILCEKCRIRIAYRITFGKAVCKKCVALNDKIVRGFK